MSVRGGPNEPARDGNAPHDERAVAVTEERAEAEPAPGSPAANDARGERQRFILDDTGFDEVPRKYRRFYRKWKGPGDRLAANEVICPVCKVVIRSSRTLLPGDRVYCMPCMSRLVVVRDERTGELEARVAY